MVAKVARCFTAISGALPWQGSYIALVVGIQARAEEASDRGGQHRRPPDRKGYRRNRLSVTITSTVWARDQLHRCRYRPLHVRQLNDRGLILADLFHHFAAITWVDASLRLAFCHRAKRLLAAYARRIKADLGDCGVLPTRVCAGVSKAKRSPLQALGVAAAGRK